MTSFFSTISDPPENVQITASKASACQGDVIHFNCSAYSKPAIRTYQLFENDTLVGDVSVSGVWKRRMSHGGVFVYQCVANNSGGTGNSKSVTVIVNGKHNLKRLLFYNLLLLA